MNARFFLFILICLGYACTSDEQEEKEEIVARPSIEYTRWHSGKFYYRERPTGTFLINRTDSIQEEFIKLNGMVVEFDISWQNDSMYTLSYARLSENPNKNELAEGIDKLVKNCKITRLTDLHYIEEATSNLTDSIIRTRIYRYR